MARKKISEITKELGISFQDLKKTTDRLGIEVASAKSSVEETDALRIIDTINRMKGLGSSSANDSKKPKIKAVPFIPKGAPGKAPMGKPVMPAKFKEEPKAEAKPAVKPEPVKEEPKAEVKPEPVKEEPKAEVKPEVKPEPVKEEPKAEVKPEPVKEEPKAEVKPEVKAEPAKEEPKAAPVEEEYQNAPNRPMRFKKIFDSTKAPEPKPEEKKTEEKKSEDKKDRKPKNGKNQDRNDRGDRKNNKREDRGDRPERGDKNDRKNNRGKGDRPERGDKDNRNNDRDNRNNDRPARKPAASSGDAAPMESGKKGKSKKFFDRKDKEKDNKDRGEKGHKFNKQGDGGAKNSRYFDDNSLEKQIKHRKKKAAKAEEVDIMELLPEGSIAITCPITVAGLAEQAEINVTSIIMALMKLGIMATINQTLDKDTVEMLAVDLGVDIVVTEEEPEVEEEGLELYEDTDSDLKPRAPIITVMGHVDHGKTSLLDAIRNTNVTAGESGGITQHIGASEVTINGKKIVFLDTPGHEAFTTMRARGAQVTDIAVLVVAADDSVKPQTIESISHAKAANVPIIVAINKMDKPGANPDRVKQDLSANGVLVEDWGGEVISVPVSAKKGDGITDLLEMILLQAEMLELRANPDRLALGTVIEARLDKAKGPIATLLVTNGTLKSGQSVVAGTCSGKIRVMTNYKGDAIRKAGPATAVEILGLSEVPMAGDAFNAVKSDKIAREIAANRKEKLREEVLAKNASMTLDKLFASIQEGEAKELNLIIKADVQGSVGAIVSSLEKLETPEVKIRVIHSAVGTISESDVKLAETSNAIIIGFNVRPSTAVTNQAQDSGVELRTYRVIYDIIDDIQDAMKGMLDPEYVEKVLGKAEVRDTFKVPNVGTIGGCYVTEGIVKRNEQIRLVRDGIVIHEGVISSLKRYKDDAKEVTQGYECGLGIEKYNDIKPGDVIECFTMVEVER